MPISRNLIAALTGAGRGIQSSQEMRIAEVLRQLQQKQEEERRIRQGERELERAKDLKRFDIETQSDIIADKIKTALQLNPDINIGDVTAESFGGLSAIEEEIGRQREEVEGEKEFEERITVNTINNLRESVNPELSAVDNANILGLDKSFIPRIESALESRRREDILKESDLQVRQGRLALEQARLRDFQERRETEEAELEVRRGELEVRQKELKLRIESGGFTPKERYLAVEHSADDKASAFAITVVSSPSNVETAVEDAYANAGHLISGMSEEVRTEKDFLVRTLKDLISSSIYQASYPKEKLEMVTDLFASAPNLRMGLKRASERELFPATLGVIPKATVAPDPAAGAGDEDLRGFVFPISSEPING